MNCWHSVTELKSEVLGSLWFWQAFLGAVWKIGVGLCRTQSSWFWHVGEGNRSFLHSSIVPCTAQWTPCPHRPGKCWSTTSPTASNTLLWQLYLAGSWLMWCQLERAAGWALIPTSPAYSSCIGEELPWHTVKPCSVCPSKAYLFHLIDCSPVHSFTSRRGVCFF